jgi:hypothetical protein
MPPASKRGRGRPPVLPKLVEKLEAGGETPLADRVREVAGLPPRPLTPDEDFIKAVRDLVDMRPVAFHADNDELATHWAQLVRELPASSPNLKYKVKVDGVRVEVRLVSASE